MIAKSDLIILCVASAALTIGVGRWYMNTQSVDAVTIPASARADARVQARQQARAERQDSRFNGFLHVSDRGDPGKALGTDAPRHERTTAAEPTAQRQTAEQPADATDSRSTEPDYGIHTVQSGDYLGLLADRYQTSVSQLQTLNDIDGTTIHVGQELRYPQSVR